VNGFVDRDIAKAALRATAATKPDSTLPKHTGNDDEVGATTLSSRGESSMYAHAAAIGMPELFVELRHRATHDEMPGLELLRQMARQGLDWLWERWWKTHATDHPGRALGEREERRLLAERKADARRLSEAAKGQNARGAARAGPADENASIAHNGQKTGEVAKEVDRDGAIGLCNLDRKRKRHVYDGDVDTEILEKRDNAKRDGSLR
jgi:hypothetical protein